MIVNLICVWTEVAWMESTITLVRVIRVSQENIVMKVSIYT